ncbi:hypothetical protein HPB50_002514 [Hyalomma asiaticum]|uniref:Uncharacterized protein n=1 Tax=Hyalomma asiaticum TaxID=266040 RepID=A0ACB7SBD2_HYAAI|nr:hypothetical protein HPB50_002514 [Hyalomma asiaticum]
MVSSVSAAEQRPRRFGASAKASRWLVLHCELCILEELLRLLRGLRLVFKSSQARCRGLATGCFGLHIIQPPGITAAGNLRQSNARPKGQSRIPSRSNNYQTTEQPSLLRSAPCPITALVYSTIRTPRSNFSAN